MSKDTPRFAIEFGHRTLYKFRAFRTAKDKDRIGEILRGNRVWFSTSRSLKDMDPDDLRPRLRFTRGATEEATRRLLRDDAERAWARRSPPLTTEQLVRNRYWLATAPIDL